MVLSVPLLEFTHYRIEGDLVSVERIPSASQKKHLFKPKPRK